MSLYRNILCLRDTGRYSWVKGASKSARRSRRAGFVGVEPGDFTRSNFIFGLFLNYYYYLFFFIFISRPSPHCDKVVLW